MQAEDTSRPAPRTPADVGTDAHRDSGGRCGVGSRGARPGVRPASAAMGDQKRAVTPRQARDAGASVLVIGRPIARAEDPDQAARDIMATL